jgi:hypothetical protein
MLRRSTAIAIANALTFHATLNQHEHDVAELDRLAIEREVRLVEEEQTLNLTLTLTLLAAAGETAKEVQKEAWLAARAEWNKEVLQKQRLKRRHRIGEQTLGMKNQFNAR